MRTFFSFVLLAFALSCETDDDCALNGECSSSTCVCSAGWTGETCGVIKLAPAPIDGGYHVLNTSSWGGALMLDAAKNTYHMFAAEFVNHCGLASWHSNSRVIHATSRAAAGPYVFVEEVIPYYSHNPTVALSVDKRGLYLMHIGNGIPDVTPPLHCKNGSTQTNYTASGAPLVASFVGATSIGTLCAESFAGPWVSCNWTGAPTGFTNPTLFSMSDDSLLVGGNTNYSLALTHGTNCTKFACASWTSPESVLPNRTGEDPWIWRDQNNHWHALLHDMSPDLPAGRHAYSRDGFSWKVSEVLAYNGTVTFHDGSTVSFSKRERPHLLLDPETRAPLALSTGVMQFGEHIDDYSWTLVQEILQ